ncbi:SCO6880 family protein [Leifsonia sp. NPDC102414]|uniref:SCO6880 family protein n=1 Tax=Leifsonia sp. NPDC102414 TaxID=3364124 RepID=UPI0038100889
MRETVIVEDLALPSDRFGRRERGGVLGSGFDIRQILIATVILGVGVVWVISDAAAFFGGPIWLIIALMGVVVSRYRGEPIVTVGTRPIAYFARNWFGQTLYLRDPWRTPKEIEMKTGIPTGGATKPEPVGTFALPGAAGNTRMYQSGHTAGGAFLIDMKGQTVAITVGVNSRAWKLRDRSVQTRAFDGFVEWLNSLNTLPGLVQLDARVRVDSAPATQLGEYARKQDHTAGPNQVHPRVIAEYDALVEQQAPKSMQFSNTVTFTFALRGLLQQIKDNGGGLSGIDGYMVELVSTLKDTIEQADLTLTAWVKARGLEAVFARAMDPIGFTARMQQSDPATRASLRHPPVMGITEHPDRVVVDGSVHQVFWLSEWPRTTKTIGFLSRLLYAGDSTRVLLLQMKPVPDHKAASRVVSRRTALETARSIREKNQVTETVEQRKELEEIEEREERISEGYADIEFRGFIALSAADTEGLDRARSAVAQAARGLGITLALMHFQQAAAFTTVALPLNAKGKA